MVETALISASASLVAALVPALKLFLQKWGKLARAELETGETLTGEVIDVAQRRQVREMLVRTKDGNERWVPLRNIEHLTLEVDGPSAAQAERDQITKTVDREAVSQFLSENPEAEAIFLELFDRGCLNAADINSYLSKTGYNVDLRRTNGLLRKLQDLKLVLSQPKLRRI